MRNVVMLCKSSCAGAAKNTACCQASMEADLQGLEVEAVCMPAAEHCPASLRYPGSAAQVRGRSCQPLPQLLLHACQGPACTLAKLVPSAPDLPASMISAHAVPMLA